MPEVEVRSPESLSRVTDFILHEADLADEHRYDEWLALWNPEKAFYYIPYEWVEEPTKRVAIIRDNYARLCERMTRLKSGDAHTQQPPSVLCRVLGTPSYRVIEDDYLFIARTNFVCVEARLDRQVTWAGKVKYTISSRGSDRLELHEKVVHLVNTAAPMPALTFII